jgi:superkiller protein 3
MNKFIAFVIACLIAFVGCKNDKKTTKTNNTEVVANSEETIETITEKIRENPLNADLFLKRSEIYMANLDAAKAIADAELALKLDSLRPDIYTRISDYNLTIGESETARNILLKAIEKFPLNTEVRLKLAYIYFYVEMYNSAMDQIAFIEENKIHDAETYFLKALIFEEVGRSEAAISAFKMAIEYNNEFWEAHNLLGMTYARLGNDMAVEHFYTATRLFPDNLEIRYHAGYVYQQFEHFDRAIEEYEYIIEKDPDYFFAYFNLGNIYVNNKKDYSKAIEYYSKAIAVDTLSHEAYYNRGYAYELQGNYDLAISDYRTSLKIHPNYELALQGLNEILEKR